MKKILLALGTVTAVATPIVTVVSCGSNSSTKKETNTNPVDTHINEHEADNNGNGDKANKNVDNNQVGTKNSDNNHEETKNVESKEETKIEFVSMSADRTKVAEQLFAKITADPKSGLDAFNGQTISDVEMFGSLVRGTLTSPAAISRVTFNIKTGKLIKVETKVNDEFKDNSLSFLAKFTDANEIFIEKLITDNFKKIVEQEISETTLAEIEKVPQASDEATQSASIKKLNEIIENFVSSEGFGLAFDQDHENKVVEIVNSGYEYGVAQRVSVVWNTGGFGEKIEGGKVYITYTDKSIYNGNQILAWDTSTKFINRRDREDNLFEEQLDKVITAAFAKATIK